jgi:hypothetical protein
MEKNLRFVFPSRNKKLGLCGHASTGQHFPNLSNSRPHNIEVQVAVRPKTFSID